MRTHLLQHVSGGLLGFQVSNLWLQPREAARLLRSKGAEITYRRRFLVSPRDVHLKFRYAGFEFQLVEPYGDSSCYEVIPDGSVRPPDAVLMQVSDFFEQYRPGVVGVIASMFGG